MTDITELATVLRLAAESEIACRAEGDTSDLWQDEVSPDNILALVEALETGNTENERMAREIISRNGEIEGLRRHITELEESHAQVIQSRDHYKRMSEESLKKLAESRTVTVKLPEPFKLAKSSSGLTYYYADEVNEALTAQGIKWEAE